MPSRDPDAASVPSDASRWQRFSGAVSNFVLKPAVISAEGTPERPASNDVPDTVPELEAVIKRANDKERNIGLVAAPVAALIGLLVTGSLVANDPKALINGQINPHHTNPTLYVELGLVAIVLALVMLGSAWFRKRFFLGVAMALYGLSLFNLHYWGFGVPYILAGAWYLVRTFRLQEKLKKLKTEGGGSFGAPGQPAAPNKRYTPPAVSSRPVAKQKKPGKQRDAS
jgi:hypothetical protein